MADNITLNVGTSGAVIAADDIGPGVYWPYSKLAFGAADTANIVTSTTTNPLPVALSDTDNAVLDVIAADTTSLDGKVTACNTGAVVIASGTVTAVTDITNTIDSTISGAALTALQKIDNLAHSGSDVALVEHVPISGQYDDVATTTVTENQIAPVRINASRALHVDGSAVTQPVSGTVTASGPVTDAELRATPVPVSGTVTANPASGTITTVSTVTNLSEMGGVAISLNTGVRDAGTQRVTIATNDSVPVTGTITANAGTGTFAISAASLPSHDVTNAGTFAVQLSAAGGLTALELIDNASVAHDAAVVAGVTQIGLDARTADPTAVGTGDATRALATTLGKQVIQPYAIPQVHWSYATATLGVTDTASDEAKAAGAAGVRNYITGVQVMNGHATVGTEVVILDGSTVLWRGWAEPTGGGCSANFATPLKGTAATAVNVANITTGSKTYFNLQGYTALD